MTSKVKETNEPLVGHGLLNKTAYQFKFFKFLLTNSVTCYINFVDVLSYWYLFSLEISSQFCCSWPFFYTMTRLFRKIQYDKMINIRFSFSYLNCFLQPFDKSNINGWTRFLAKRGVPYGLKVNLHNLWESQVEYLHIKGEVFYQVLEA